MRKILILFAHPSYEDSRANQTLIEQVQNMPGVTVRDLYECYPAFHVDKEAEQKILKAHDVIIFQYPFYWFSCPPLMKQWMDEVLEFGWAYGTGGPALDDKFFMNVITTGAELSSYCAIGTNSFTINEFLTPFVQTARICHMHYLPPFTITGVQNMSDEAIAVKAIKYAKLLETLQEKEDLFDFNQETFLNDIPELKKL
ncbi:MAG: NAD(P)H-dependent oxidoreductase [Weeksellaceae bacterium]